MEKIITLQIILLICLLSACSVVPPIDNPDPADVTGYVHRDGIYIVDGSGSRIWLNGFGLGGWLVPEGYMIHSYSGNYDAPTEIINGVAAVTDQAFADGFWADYTANYVAEVDIQRIASWGANSIRVPFTWKFLMDESDLTAPYTYKESGFDVINNVINWCTTYGMYVILDMHCAPGAQSKYNIADSDGVARLWSQPGTYQPMCIDLWREIASRYADNQMVIGYDLLNEPYGDGGSNAALKNLYVAITNAIREVDKHHMLFIEGGGWAQDFNALTPPWDSNMAYAFHSYPPTSGGTQWTTFRNTWGVPVWHGETGENCPGTYAAASAYLKQNEIGVSWWTHKK
ncbi:MAG: glycoside hydrolase family 5 protein [Spirochaetales bacterium]|nr:glycoside hydrolase family 5 protein [Spirochaetales bacterium]